MLPRGKACRERRGGALRPALSKRQSPGLRCWVRLDLEHGPRSAIDHFESAPFVGLTLTLADPLVLQWKQALGRRGRMPQLGMWELMVILGIFVLLFGGKKLPEVAKGLGEGIRNFKTALKGEDKAPAAEEKKQA